ncbi:MAG: hypothetical protein CM1200mP29_14470 [Verrucomicrobiota bacterium]|nr:MAG: hypothetical protein CM1200mP29_14470 [Verrucomicrobiota bacterium]
MRVGDVALTSRADGDEQRLAPGPPHFDMNSSLLQKPSRLRSVPRNIPSSRS